MRPNTSSSTSTPSPSPILLLLLQSTDPKGSTYSRLAIDDGFWGRWGWRRGCGGAVALLWGLWTRMRSEEQTVRKSRRLQVLGWRYPPAASCSSFFGPVIQQLGDIIRNYLPQSRLILSRFWFKIEIVSIILLNSISSIVYLCSIEEYSNTTCTSQS